MAGSADCSLDAEPGIDAILALAALGGCGVAELDAPLCVADGAVTVEVEVAASAAAATSACDDLPSTSGSLFTLTSPLIAFTIARIDSGMSVMDLDRLRVLSSAGGGSAPPKPEEDDEDAVCCSMRRRARMCTRDDR